MKILIVSDTHGRNEALENIIIEEEPFDMMIHCGDLECEPYIIRDMVDCTLHMVAGNNDYGRELDQMRVFNIGQYKALLVHGHRQHIYSDLSSLFYLGMENKVDYVFFGHIHIPIVMEQGPITIVNPGSLTYPRQSERVPTYVVMTIEPGRKPEFEVIKYI